MVLIIQLPRTMIARESNKLMVFAWYIYLVFIPSVGFPFESQEGEPSKFEGSPQNSARSQDEKALPELNQNEIRWINSKDPGEEEWEIWFEKFQKSDPKVFKGIILSQQAILDRLGYPISRPYDGKYNEEFKEILSDYQKHNGLRVTGKLDKLTGDKIGKDAEIIGRKPLYLSSFLIHLDSWKEYVYAQGSFVIDGIDQGIPEQTSKISCFRRWNHCIESVASIVEDLLSVDTILFEVERWDEYEIVSKPNDTSFCTRYTLRVHRLQKAVFKQRSTKTNEGPCEGIMTEDLPMKLVSGFEVRRELDKKYSEKVQKIIRCDLLFGKFCNDLGEK